MQQSLDFIVYYFLRLLFLCLTGSFENRSYIDYTCTLGINQFIKRSKEPTDIIAASGRTPKLFIEVFSMGHHIDIF